MKRTIINLATVALIAMISFTASHVAPAHAESGRATDIQLQIDQLLQANPGGVQTSPNSISWQAGAIVLTLAPNASQRTLAVGTCPSGSFCAFSGTNLTGSRVSFTTCVTHPVGSLIGTAKSIANARTSGSVFAENASGSVLATITANGRLNSSPAGVTQLGCSG